MVHPLHEREPMTSPSSIRRSAGLAAPLLLGLFLGFAGCSSESHADGVCKKDQRVFCRCENRAAGSKQCNPDGKGWGECDCGGATGDESGDGTGAGDGLGAHSGDDTGGTTTPPEDGGSTEGDGGTSSGDGGGNTNPIRRKDGG